MALTDKIFSIIESVQSALFETSSLIIKKELEMIQMVADGGLFAYVLVITAIVCFIFIGLSIKNLLNFKKEDYQIAEFNINNIIRVGVFAAVFGILGTLTGTYAAITAIREALEISMHIVYGGINAALSTTILGLQLFVFASIAYIVLKNILVRLNK